MTIICCMVPEIRCTNDKSFCHCGPFFALLPPKNLHNQNFEKMKKIPGDIIVLYMCTKNGAWPIEFFVILNHFLHFYPPNNLKNPNFWKNENITWIYYHFTHVYHKIWSVREILFEILDSFLPFYLHTYTPPLLPHS